MSTQPPDVDDRQPPREEPRFEALLHNLEELVARLERGELPLEDALAAFERGMEVAQRAGRILDAAESRVEQLLEERDGTTREAPFEPQGG